MPESIPLWLLVALIVVAVAAGLWVGGRAERELESRKTDKANKTIAERARSVLTKGVVSIWKWNRGRQKKAKEKANDSEE